MTANALAAQGVRICGADIRGELLVPAMKEIASHTDTETLACSGDLGNENDVAAAVERAVAKWGHIDILVNNAGVRRIGPAFETSPQTWDEIHTANLRSQFLCTREVLNRSMLERDEGKIIFVSSGSGIRGEKGSSAYCASKFGVTGFSQSVAKDLKHTGIRTTTIMPGMIWTPMAEESEMAEADVAWLPAEKVADAILYCVGLDSETVIPELQIYHRAQI